YEHRDLGDAPFGYMVENRIMRQAHQDALEEQPGAQLIAPMTVPKVARRLPGSGAPAQLTLADGRQLRARLVIGADGRQSAMREQAGTRTTTWSYDQTGIVRTVAHELPHEGAAQERFLPAGPFAILPKTGDES